MREIPAAYDDGDHTKRIAISLDTNNIVMPGLDPGIHQSSKDGLPGQARQ
jgi:hypothetical protein